MEPCVARMMTVVSTSLAVVSEGNASALGADEDDFCPCSHQASFHQVMNDEDRAYSAGLVHGHPILEVWGIKGLGCEVACSDDDDV